MNVLLWILLMTVIDGIIALVGVFSFLTTQEKLKRITFFLIAFSAGTLFAGAFLHLLPESLNFNTASNAFLLLIGGFILFFIIEKFFFWHHCHEQPCRIHPVSYLILLGDGIHNFIDGLIIATSFMINISFGIITAILIFAHEIPQELGDFAILVYGGFSKRKAIIYNFVSQLTCILGGYIGYILSSGYVLSSLLLPIAAGGFIYISASDLIPELHKKGGSFLPFFLFLVGIGFMLGLKIVEQWLG